MKLIPDVLYYVKHFLYPTEKKVKYSKELWATAYRIVYIQDLYYYIINERGRVEIYTSNDIEKLPSAITDIFIPHPDQEWAQQDTIEILFK